LPPLDNTLWVVICSSLWRGEVLRKSLDTYKKKIDTNHHILFSYNIAIDYLDFIVDENLLKFFDDVEDLIRFITFELYLKVGDKFFIGLNQSSLRNFDSFSVTKTSYYEGEIGLLKVFAFFDFEKVSQEEIENFAEKYNLRDCLDGDFGFNTDIKVSYKILDLHYI
jgi:hypothetical protein